MGQTPLVPAEVMSWTVWPELEDVWYDPTKPPRANSYQSSAECGICYILNHEWLKHGKYTDDRITVMYLHIMYDVYRDLFHRG